MHRRIEHIAAELLICQSPASNSNYIFSAVFTYFLGGFLRKKRWLLGLRPRPRWGSLQRSPTPPSWAGGVPPSRTLPGAAPPTTSPHPSPHPRRCPPPPNSWIRHWCVCVCAILESLNVLPTGLTLECLDQYLDYN